MLKTVCQKSIFGLLFTIDFLSVHPFTPMADIVHNPQHIGGTKSRIKKKTKSMVGVQETES